MSISSPVALSAIFYTSRRPSPRRVDYRSMSRRQDSRPSPSQPHFNKSRALNPKQTCDADHLAAVQRAMANDALTCCERQQVIADIMPSFSLRHLHIALAH
eukprot:3305182-Rhodomonas_salina.5